MRITLLAIAAVLLLSACESEDSVTSRDIVTTIPWPETEVSTYRVLDDDDDEIAIGILSVRPGEDGEIILRQEFENIEDDFVNEAEVIVDATELQPRRATFSLEGPDGNRQCEAGYAEGTVEVHTTGEDGEHTAEVDVPPIAYDSWSDLFLWRTIDLSQGYETEYADILTCVLAQARRLGVKIEVRGAEEVEVPAGTFEAWHLEIEAGNDQDAWIAVEEPHVLVRYDNGEQVFELTDYSEEPGT